MSEISDFKGSKSIPEQLFETLNRDELKQRLTLFFSDLLQHDFNQLCTIIYRHDVSEIRFREVLQIPDLDVQAEQIADLVIERELQKIATRKAYRKYKESHFKNPGD